MNFKYFEQKVRILNYYGMHAMDTALIETRKVFEVQS